MKNIIIFSFLFVLIFIIACDPDELDTDIDLTGIAYNPVNDTLPLPFQFPQVDIPADNPITKDGFELGRRLFYDPMLSADSSQSCSSCHFQANAFAEPRALSVGIDGIEGTRNAMPLFNLAYNFNGFFWDGRAATLEVQALEPIENPIEMHDTWKNVEIKLRRQPMYQEYFRKAFGIEKASEIDRDLATKALAQFMRSMVSYRSKYDKVIGAVPVQGVRPIFTAEEQRGRDLFFIENGDSSDTECFHCHHGSPLFTNNTYRNNGLDFAASFNDFSDNGFGETTGIPADNGRFRTPSLRNIELTAPYMHDGRFQTLEEVMDFYNEHIKSAPNLDSNLGARLPGLNLSEQDKKDLIAFMKTLTDDDFITDGRFSNPF